MGHPSLLLNYPCGQAEDDGEGQVQEPGPEPEEDQARLRRRRRQAAQGGQEGTGAQRDIRTGRDGN